MTTDKKNTMCLCGEVCEIVHSDGHQVQIKILCKPDHILFESHASTDIHLGDKVILTLTYEAQNIVPFNNQTKIETN